MIVAGGIDWTNVLIAFIAGLPAIIAAVGVILLHREIQTPSGRPIGRQVEDSHHTAIANNQRLVSIGDKVDAIVPPLAVAQEAKVDELPDNENGEPVAAT